MDSYQRYRQARDTAWRALLQVEEASLPVDAEGLAEKIGAQVHSLEDAQEMETLAGVLDRAPGGVCVSLQVQGKWHIFVKSGLDAARRRFAVAHELGHLLTEGETRALSRDVRCFVSLPATGDLMDETEDTPDYAADIFAIRLLAPACVLHEMRCETAGQIAALCGLPPRAAAFRSQRMELLNERDAFYTHSLERRVRDRFLPVIRAARVPAPDAPVRGFSAPAVIPPRKEDTADKARKVPWLYPAAAVAGAAAGGVLLYLLTR